MSTRRKVPTPRAKGKKRSVKAPWGSGPELTPELKKQLNEVIDGMGGNITGRERKLITSFLFGIAGPIDQALDAFQALGFSPMQALLTINALALGTLLGIHRGREEGYPATVAAAAAKAAAKKAAASAAAARDATKGPHGHPQSKKPRSRKP